MIKRNSFNGIAPYYDLLAGLVFGHTISRSQSYYFDEVFEGAEVLVVGGGSGKILPDLAKQLPRAITFLEPSERMLEQAVGVLPDNRNIEFVSGSIDDLPVGAYYDVIITSFVLDLFVPQELSRIMQILTDRLSERGRWLFTDFHRNPSLDRFWQGPLVSLMYLFFRITCNIDGRGLLEFHQYFESCGLQLAKSASFYSGMISSKVYIPNSSVGEGAFSPADC